MGVARLCPRCGSSAHGQPSVRVAAGLAPDVSIAYAAGLVVVAWSFSGPVGVDVEQQGPPVDLGDETVERAEWTRREARFKAARSDLPTMRLTGLPTGYVGTVVGRDVHWQARPTSGWVAPEVRPAGR